MFHILQPLNLGLFSILKVTYKRTINQLDSTSDSTFVGKLNFLKCYIQAHNEAFVSKYIKAGFKVTGIWPRNRNKILKNHQVLICPIILTTAIVSLQNVEKGGDIMTLAKNYIPDTKLKIRRAIYKFDMLVVDMVLKDYEIQML